MLLRWVVLLLLRWATLLLLLLLLLLLSLLRLRARRALSFPFFSNPLRSSFLFLHHCRGTKRSRSGTAILEVSGQSTARQLINNTSIGGRSLTRLVSAESSHKKKAMACQARPSVKGRRVMVANPKVSRI